MSKYINIEMTNNGIFILRNNADTHAFTSYKDLEAFLNTELNSPKVAPTNFVTNPWGIASTPGTTTAAGPAPVPTSKW